MATGSQQLSPAEKGLYSLPGMALACRGFTDSKPGPAAELQVLDSRFYTALALGGDIGFGEAYAKGWWASPDLEALMLFLARNQERMRLAVALGISAPLVSLSRGLRRLGGSRNHRRGARKNIMAHYDLGDKLFQHLLDPFMAYSSAIFEHEEATLQQAQEAKFRRIAEQLELRPEDRVLEIGSGCGGFALWTARNIGCRVEGVTISDNQLAFARRRAAEEGLDRLVSFRLQDYRDIQGQFDKVVSIEMLEAVGHEYHPRFFDALERLTAPGGMDLLQFIAIRDQRYDACRFQGGWIRKHIFPGGCCRRCRARWSSCAAARASPCATWNPWPRTTPEPWPCGARTCRTTRPRWKSWVTMPPSAGPGSTTSPTARPGLPAGSSRTSSCCLRDHRGLREHVEHACPKSTGGWLELLRQQQ